jgi:uncharacterized protein YdeI (YjbR/CyaY-like superfamily)
MGTSTTIITVDDFIAKNPRWRREYIALIGILREFGMIEEIKWGKPCYSLQKNNIVLVHGFKDYCALLFFQGALLKDPHHILVQQTPHVQSARQIRFTNLKDIENNQEIIKKYIKQAIEINKKGLKVAFKSTEDYEVVDEFNEALAKMPDLKAAFEQLTPGRQRHYLLYFSSLKTTKTRMIKIEKYTEHIIKGKGLYEV